MSEAVPLPSQDEVRRKYFEFDGLDWGPFAKSIGLHPRNSRLDYPTMRWRQEKYQMQLLEKAERINHDLLEARMDTYSQAAKLIVQYPKTAEMMLNAIHNEVVKHIAESQAKKIPINENKIEKFARALRHVAYIHDTYVFRKLPELKMFEEDSRPKDVTPTANKDKVVYMLKGVQMTPTEAREAADKWYDKPVPPPPPPPEPSKDPKDGNN